MKKKENKPFTWADLKKAVNNFSEEILHHEVRWWGDERGGTVKYIHILEEPHVQTDEGFEPSSVINEADKEYYKDAELPKGYPIISVD